MKVDEFSALVLRQIDSVLLISENTVCRELSTLPRTHFDYYVVRYTLERTVCREHYRELSRINTVVIRASKFELTRLYRLRFLISDHKSLCKPHRQNEMGRDIKVVCRDVIVVLQKVLTF